MLFGAGGFKAFLVEGDAGVAGGIDHEVERQAESFVEVKGLGSPSESRPFELLHSKSREADLEHAIKLLFFGFDDFGDAGGGVVQLGIGALHQVADGVDHLVQEWLFLAEQAAMADAAAKDFAQDVAAAFVRGQDAVVDEEGGGAGVVGDDAEAGVAD